MGQANAATWDWRRFRRLATLVLAGVGAVAAWKLGPVWIVAWYSGLPRPLVRRTIIDLATGLLLADRLVLIVAPLAMIGLGWRLARGRRRHLDRSWTARALALCASSLAAVGLLEGLAKIQWDVEHPPPDRAPIPAQKILQKPQERGADTIAVGAKPELFILVLGGSSARGEPYHPWVSVGSILAWQLERVFPGRTVRVETWAQGGVTLARMFKRLPELDRRPDAIIVYSGHNEFQGRYSWSRVVNYYPEDFHQPKITLAERLGTHSPLGAVVSEIVRIQTLDLPPPNKPTIDLVERPCCTPKERAEILEAFSQQLEAIVRLCEHFRALPILIGPPGNDAGFEPDRSTLPPTTRKAERLAFAHDFRAARGLEEQDASRAVAAYRALLDRQPGFAETHYRLARLLARAGHDAEANYHFIRARDLDGMPMRCPSDFLAAYHRISQRHRVVLVDGPTVLGHRVPERVVGDLQIHDGQHPTFRSYIALTQAVLDQLPAFRAFGWPAGLRAPTIDPDECAAHFGMTPARWAEVCDRTADFYERTAYIRHNPAYRLGLARRLRAASPRIVRGTPPELAGIPGLGVHPPGLDETRELRDPDPRSSSPQTAGSLNTDPRVISTRPGLSAVSRGRARGRPSS